MSCKQSEVDGMNSAARQYCFAGHVMPKAGLVYSLEIRKGEPVIIRLRGQRHKFVSLSTLNQEVAAAYRRIFEVYKRMEEMQENIKACHQRIELFEGLFNTNSSFIRRHLVGAYPDLAMKGALSLKQNGESYILTLSGKELSEVEVLKTIGDTLMPTIVARDKTHDNILIMECALREEEIAHEDLCETYGLLLESARLKIAELHPEIDGVINVVMEKDEMCLFIVENVDETVDSIPSDFKLRLALDHNAGEQLPEEVIEQFGLTSVIESIASLLQVTK
ncbi:hypothetical protein HGA64_02715 [Candidatus Falkowbacteria bacterium]|nr:hypothetical protein [Candidatus Falkowbacteria bacterium]